ncbi:MAG TPA: prepilin-type N-terminal cleavage/methylation domain-containing protein [Humisphaera sp.]|jgi:prepilin-type N-terminal cleavage/methylation domain-containing protein|nr:prepilin-type N-terminal cleavage/methylation domain-containing protein [Humisphaera sp.]
MNRRGFSLIELMIATALSVALMGAVLAILSNIARDTRRLAGAQASSASQNLIELLHRDLSSSRTMIQAPDGSALVLVGHGWIDPATLNPTGRLARTTYQCIREGQTRWLIRQQESMDDPGGPKRWRTLVAANIESLLVNPAVTDSAAPDPRAQADESPNDPPATRAGVAISVPPRVRVQISLDRAAISQEIWVK